MGFFRLLLIMGCVLLAACAEPGPPEQTEIADLARAIRALDAQVDPAEAERAAQIAYLYPLQLAREYEVTDPPLVHNTKVNMGLRPRGLCWHWAEDMERRLKQEGFETLVIHRAIANSDRVLRIDHSTAIVAAKGAGMYDGIVLDPWRKGYGRLTWMRTVEDRQYEWKPQHEVLATRLGTKRTRRVAY
ncbi:hypothetical protein FLO80_05290 [Aquicoccus porphyridii]|uniref:Lipoprotein n=1 Tax=Aquicoccus porphyridii TaxID=1852029 RepID=A0A5A9ZJJ0_9RHOB|nr:hypothetical protein [Aquicoccus porphyridii]KAA0917464.1 hypothetical protein FLO80_05290 [Aquicoccus porphyridii]RAI55551.1 hypothetical protein DOO74_03815 [Rhodobacteraceae bacterium AsT-22]